jgi:glycine/D-amino acid oxidase-like deaminating enzyme
MSAAGGSSDVLVAGGGLLGLSIAYGIARLGHEVTVLDEGDVAWRASRGNFGLVWVQNKGSGLPQYAAWSRDAAALWPMLARDLQEETGIDVALHQPGGFFFCYSDAELRARESSLRAIQQQVEGPYPYQMLSHEEVRERLPRIGAEVAGASFTPMDGHANPLKLYRALDEAGRRRGVRAVRNAKVEAIRFDDGRFEVATAAGRFTARRIVLAAGLGNRELAPQVGLHAPVVPTRGQILVTERLQPFLPYPTNKLRQTDEGTVQVGDSIEDVGFNDETSHEVLRFMAQRAIRTFPLLRDVNLVRAWGALRVMTPDGFPIYEESQSCPGAFVATCHSGVTLAAQHALKVAPWIAGHAAPPGIEVFRSERLRSPAHAPMYVN